MDLTVLTQDERKQYDLDIQKGIVVGSLFEHHTGYISESGVFVVTGLWLSPAVAHKHTYNQRPARLCVHARRVVDGYGTRIKNSKVNRTVQVEQIRVERILTKATIEAQYETEMKRAHADLESALRHAAEKRVQLMTLLGA